METDLQGVLILGGLLFRHTPAQVNIHQPQFPLLAPLPELGEYPLDEVVPLAIHVIERAADEDADSLPGCGHG